MGFPTPTVERVTAAGVLALLDQLTENGQIAGNSGVSACLPTSCAAATAARAWHLGCSVRPGNPRIVFETLRKGIRMTPENAHASDEVLQRVQGEFLEMPGLRLTEAQAR